MPIIENWKLVVLERYAKFDGRAGRADSVAEVALAGEDHRDAVLVGGLRSPRRRVPAAGLDHGGDARRGRGVEAVAEREERVARAHAAVGAAGRAIGGDAGRVEPVLLTGTDAERLRSFA
jgi:hypothetical protein